jgi:hypothetical protein
VCRAKIYSILNGENCTHVTHALFEYFSSGVRIDRTKKQNKQKEEKFWSREKEREMPAGREIKI